MFLAFWLMSYLLTNVNDGDAHRLRPLSFSEDGYTIFHICTIFLYVCSLDVPFFGNAMGVHFGSSESVRIPRFCMSQNELALPRVIARITNSGSEVLSSTLSAFSYQHVPDK
jgi:hypothetical protein